MGIFKRSRKRSNKIDFDKLFEEDDCQVAIIEIDEWLNEISEYGENLNKLTPEGQLVLIIENLEREINNGGFNQFYFNSSGDYAHETVEYLRTIRANHTSLIVEKANKEWPSNQVPKEREERQNILEKIEEKAEQVWSKCDDQFYEYQDDIATLLLDYIKANRVEIEKNK